jgi:CheY-like chemotaxis protein
MPIPSILLVDDDEIDAEMVSRAFRQQKIANPLIHAMDGLCALALLRGETAVAPPLKSYIILLDIQMPGMSGLDFLHELRQDPALKRSVVFMLTTSDAPQDIDAAYNENVAGYILKQTVGPDFENALRLLDNYQTLVILPN